MGDRVSDLLVEEQCLPPWSIEKHRVRGGLRLVIVDAAKDPVAGDVASLKIAELICLAVNARGAEGGLCAPDLPILVEEPR